MRKGCGTWGNRVSEGQRASRSEERGLRAPVALRRHGPAGMPLSSADEEFRDVKGWGCGLGLRLPGCPTARSPGEELVLSEGEASVSSDLSQRSAHRPHDLDQVRLGVAPQAGGRAPWPNISVL